MQGLCQAALVALLLVNWLSYRASGALRGNFAASNLRPARVRRLFYRKVQIACCPKNLNAEIAKTFERVATVPES